MSDTHILLHGETFGVPHDLHNLISTNSVPATAAASLALGFFINQPTHQPHPSIEPPSISTTTSQLSGSRDDPSLRQPLPFDLFQFVDMTTLPDLQCCICQEPFGTPGETFELPVRLGCSAGHVFGEACIRTWLDVSQELPNRTCPLCREEVVPPQPGDVDWSSDEEEDDDDEYDSEEEQSGSVTAPPTRDPWDYLLALGELNEFPYNTQAILDTMRARQRQTARHEEPVIEACFGDDLLLGFESHEWDERTGFCGRCRACRLLQPHEHIDPATGEIYFDGLPSVSERY